MKTKVRLVSLKIEKRPLEINPVLIARSASAEDWSLPSSPSLLRVQLHLALQYQNLMTL